MTKKRVLFVDDEPNILDGLRRMLRSMRKEFELCFADGGVNALKMISEKGFDIVVSDMRMPGMDGAQFLTEVKKVSPQSIRIMLTGQADDESVMRTVGVVHQFLAKPCDPTKLKEILLRSSALHQILVDGQLKEMITAIDTLPSVPTIYMELQEKIADPAVELNDVAEIISKDMAMTAKILQLVNSAFFGLFQKVETPLRAVSLLGLDTIKSLALGVQIFSDKSLSTNAQLVDELWRHSMQVGAFAKKITYAETGDNEAASEALFAGILHDIGKLILLTKMEKKYAEVITAAESQSSTMFDAEKKILNSSHCEMGAYLIGLWGFGTDVIEAIGFHHQLENYPAQTFTPALAVHVANVYEHQLNPEQNSGTIHQLDMDYIKSRGFESRLADWKELCQEELSEINE